MAKAVANCVCKTCGAKFQKISTKRNKSIADSWEKWAVDYYDECDDCIEKSVKEHRAAVSKEAAEEAKELALPELKGSEKQIAWAETIRMDFYKRTSDEMDSFLIQAKAVPEKQENRMKKYKDITIFRNWLFAKADSKFWIDNRNLFCDPAFGIRTAELELSEMYTKECMQNELKEEVDETTVVIEPEDKKYSTLCEVTYDEKAVVVKSDYCQYIPPVVKEAGYRWNGHVWSRTLGITTGGPEDRAVEIANKLLLAGFPIKIDKAISERAITGDYIPEHKRWITYSIKRKKLIVESEVQDIAQKARLITGASKYGSVLIPVSSWEEVFDFANMYGFRFSPGAQKEIDDYKSKIVKSHVIAGQEARYNETDTKLILESSRDVLEDLRDED